jgi:hypothetical protein
MDKCVAILKSGSRKGEHCDSSKKVIDIINGKEVPHCNRHKIKSKQKYNVVDVLTTNLNKTLKITENNKNSKFEKEEIDEFIDSREQNILNKLDKQLDDLFNEYGL